MRNMEPLSNRCIAQLNEIGELCLEQAYCFDEQRAGLVCREHAPIGTLQQLWSHALRIRVHTRNVREPEFAST